MCDMIDRFAQLHLEDKAIFIVDRGYVSLNVLAHAIENGVFFLIRAWDPSCKRTLSNLDLPDEPEFDLTFERWLTRRNTSIIKTHFSPDANTRNQEDVEDNGNI